MAYEVDANGRAEAALEVPASVAAGAALDVSKLRGPYEVEFSDVGTSTHAIEVSYAASGSNWVEVASVTASAVVRFDLSPRRIRTRTSAHTSGTPSAKLTTVHGR